MAVVVKWITKVAVPCSCGRVSCPGNVSIERKFNGRFDVKVVSSDSDTAFVRITREHLQELHDDIAKMLESDRTWEQD